MSTILRIPNNIQNSAVGPLPLSSGMTISSAPVATKTAFHLKSMVESGVEDLLLIILCVVVFIALIISAIIYKFTNADVAKGFFAGMVSFMPALYVFAKVL